MRTAQEKHDTDAQAEKEKSQKAVDDSINASAKKQEDARTQVKSKVATQRGAWTEGQTKAVTTAQQKGDTAVGDADKTVAKQRADGEASAQGEIDKGDEDIRKEREKAEKTARDERANAKKESHEGFLGWIGSKVSSFFNSIKQAIGDAFDAARKFVKAAIKKAQELAVKVIDAARDAIVSAIKLAGEALMEIGDVMLAAFPELRDKYKKAIQGLVDDAVAAVDALADELKKDVVAFLDLLGKGLDALLGLLLDALNAIVDAVASYVKGIIDAAKAVIQALGAFWQIIKDVAANPGQWISNLGASVVDGIKHHLIKAFKKAIKKWFNDTVESVIGVGKAILGLLRKGGITFKMIAKMAWEALKAAIPSMLIQLLIEKLVAMIVPAAGALMTIIEGIKAAWGTIQQIIAAFEIFMKFLKAVKGGSAGRLFAETLASAAIVVIQFVAQWLLGKLKGGAGGKVGGKLREMAKKIMDGLKKAGKAIGRAARRVGRAIVKGVKAIVKGVKRGAKWVAGKVKKVIQKIANNPVVKKILDSPAVKKVLGAVKKGIAKVKGWVDKGKKKFKEWREKRKKKKAEKKKDREKKRQERIEKAIREVPPKVQAMVAKGPRKLMLALRLRALKAWYRLKFLSIHGSRPNYTVEGQINPKIPEVLIFGIDSVTFLEAVEIVAADWGKKRKVEQGGRRVASAVVEARERGKGDGEKVVGATEAGNEIKYERDGRLALAIGSAKPRSYAEMAHDLRAMSDDDQRDFGKSLVQLLKKKAAKKDFATLGEVFGASVDSERLRHKKSFVYALMAAQTMAVGDVSASKMYSPVPGEGVFAPAFVGAVQGQAGTRKLVKLSRGGTAKKKVQASLDTWADKEKKNAFSRGDPDDTFKEAHRREVAQIEIVGRGRRS